MVAPRTVVQRLVALLLMDTVLSLYALSLKASPQARRAGVVSDECDVVVIGAGLGGLSSASVLSSLYGQKVQVFEAHSRPGGCAHSFQIKSKKSSCTYNFDSGPTITLGCSAPPYNPLAQVLKAVGAGDYIDWIQYDRWGMVTENGSWPFVLGEQKFETGPLKQYGGPFAVEEFQALRVACAPLCAGAASIPTMALRSDTWKILPLLPHIDALKKVIPYADVLNGSFEPFLAQHVRDLWLKSWLDALAFSLSGLPAGKTGAATMAYTLYDLHREGATLDYPRGGFGEIAEAFVRVVEETGSKVHLSSTVASIAVEGGRAAGVILGDGTFVRARRGVVCNANLWALPALLKRDEAKLSTSQKAELVEAPATVAKTKTFSHLHLGLDASGLDRSKLLPHYTVMDLGLHSADPCADRNMVAVSNPSLLDASLVSGEDAENKLMIHAYTAGNEPYEPWKDKSGTANYDKRKEESCEILFRSVSRALGISREELARRTDVQLLGSPYTHARYLRRQDGTYGAEFGSMLAGPTTTLPGLFLAGDGTFPGIGVPAVAVSGAQAANSMVSVARHILFGHPK